MLVGKCLSETVSCRLVSPGGDDYSIHSRDTRILTQRKWPLNARQYRMGRRGSVKNAITLKNAISWEYPMLAYLESDNLIETWKKTTTTKHRPM